jgi:uridylate kinase
METIVMSVGGSLIVPDQIDIEFLKNLKQFILDETAKGRHFIIIAGGGRTARNYQEAAKAVTGLDNEDLDWLGIHSTRLNGHLLRTIFKDNANPRIVMNYIDDLEEIEFTENILVGAGWKPGWSTDYDAVLMAEKYGAEVVINLSNVTQVCSEDPRENPDAIRYDNLSWSEFQKLVGDVWDPGMSAPFDPIASKKATGLGLTVAILNGGDLANLESYMNSEEFVGTIIKN